MNGYNYLGGGINPIRASLMIRYNQLKRVQGRAYDYHNPAI